MLNLNMYAMNLKNLIIYFSIIALLFNCSSDSSEDLHEHNHEEPDPTAKITYVGNVKAIIDSRCISCHGTTPTQNAPMSLVTYTQVKSYVDGIISRINSTTSPMPPSPNSPLSPTQIDLIEQWKADGLFEN